MVSAHDAAHASDPKHDTLRVFYIIESARAKTRTWDLHIISVALLPTELHAPCFKTIKDSSSIKPFYSFFCNLFPF